MGKNIENIGLSGAAARTGDFKKKSIKEIKYYKI